MSTMLGSVDARLGFRVAKRRLSNPKGPFRLSPQRIKDQVILSQSYLRFEVGLQTSQTDYQFPIVITQTHANGAETSPYEYRLQLQDSFFVSGIFMGLMLYNDHNNSGHLANNLYTFASTDLKNDCDINLIRVLWASQLQLTVNNRVQCPAWDTFRHYYAPESQKPYFAVDPASYQRIDEQDGSQDGFYPVEPNWTLIGSKNNILRFTLPTALTSAAFTTNTKFRMVVIVRGVLAQNSTDVGNN